MEPYLFHLGDRTPRQHKQEKYHKRNFHWNGFQIRAMSVFIEKKNNSFPYLADGTTTYLIEHDLHN